MNIKYLSDLNKFVITDDPYPRPLKLDTVLRKLMTAQNLNIADAHRILLHLQNHPTTYAELYSGQALQLPMINLGNRQVTIVKALETMLKQGVGAEIALESLLNAVREHK